jgi:DNA polymerase-3 subunit epsilon
MTMELKHLTLSRPLVVLDLESTGLNPSNDRIVEIALVVLSPGSPFRFFHSLVNPARSIPSLATAIHGIADADVADAPRFKTIAADLAHRLNGCDLAGFGLSSFDLPLLSAEFARAGISFPLAGRAILDALQVYRRHEPRSLAAAVAFYLARDHTGAHSALADAHAAIEVLDKQVGMYALPPTPNELHAKLVEVDIAAKFRRTDAGVVFGFGKYAGRLLDEIARADPYYLEWVLKQPFLDDVHALVRAALVTNRTPR